MKNFRSSQPRNSMNFCTEFCSMWVSLKSAIEDKFYIPFKKQSPVPLNIYRDALNVTNDMILKKSLMENFMFCAVLTFSKNLKFGSRKIRYINFKTSTMKQRKKKTVNVWHYPFSAYANFSVKLTFLILWYAYEKSTKPNKLPLFIR